MKHLMPLLCVTSLVLAAEGATRVWDNDGADCRWSNPVNWSDDAAPVLNDTVQINAACSAGSPVVVDGAATNNTVYLGQNAGSEGHLSLTAGGSMFCDDELYIGYNGKGSLFQTGGSTIVSRRIQLGYGLGAEGNYVIDGGMYRPDAWQSHIGVSGTGIVSIINGEMWPTGEGGRHVFIGDNATGYGRVEIAKLGAFTITNVTSDLYVGYRGRGEIFVNGGTLDTRRSIFIGQTNFFDSASKLVVNDGKLQADQAVQVGVYGRGELFVSTTNMSAGHIYTAQHPGSHGRAEFTNSFVQLFSSGCVVVGERGHGELLMRGTVINGNANAGKIAVRQNESASGVLRGSGTLSTFSGGLVNNGLIVADGFGATASLVVSGDSGHNPVFAATIENTSTNGVYARNGGKLVTYPIRLAQAADPRDYTWGDAADDPEIDMVNSVRVTVPGNSNGSAFMHVSLQAPDRDDVPAMPKNAPVVGLWEIGFSGISSLASADVEARYDHVASGRNAPQMYQYDPVNEAWTKLVVEELQGHRAKVSGLPVFASPAGRSLGLIAALRQEAASLVIIK